MSRRLSGVLVVLATAAAACSASGASHGVHLERVPGGGIQPQAVTDSTGLVHIVVISGTGGEALLAWVEDTAWAKGGSVAWQVYDREGRATSEHGRAPGVPVWGLVAAAPLPKSH